MASDFIDWNAPSLQGKLPKLPQKVRHTDESCPGVDV